MKLIQITDLHVGSENEFTHGVDVRQNFLDILRAAASYTPDLVVVSGDLAFDTPDEGVYRWMKAQLDGMGMPYAIIGGNHDNSTLLAQVFGLEHLLTDGDLYYKLVAGGRSLLLMETSSGTVSASQIAWLAHELVQLGGPAVLFMHHPPILSGVPFIDINYPLLNMAEVQAVLYLHPYPTAVFCGHYHVEKTICSKNLTVHITPSTYLQIDGRHEEFQIDHYRPALREINLRDDGVVESAVVYYEGNKTG